MKRGERGRVRKKSYKRRIIRRKRIRVQNMKGKEDAGKEKTGEVKRGYETICDKRKGRGNRSRYVFLQEYIEEIKEEMKWVWVSSHQP